MNEKNYDIIKLDGATLYLGSNIADPVYDNCGYTTSAARDGMSLDTSTAFTEN